MKEEERVWWLSNKTTVDGLLPYNYLKLLQEGEVKFKWNRARVSFLKRWWWEKYGQEWLKKSIQGQSVQDKLL